MALALTGSATARAMGSAPVKWERAGYTVALVTPREWTVDNCGIDDEAKPSTVQAEMVVAQHPAAIPSFVVAGVGTVEGIAQLLRDKDCAPHAQVWEQLQACGASTTSERTLGIPVLQSESRESWFVCGFETRNGVTRYVLGLSNAPAGDPARIEAQHVLEGIRFTTP